MDFFEHYPWLLVLLNIVTIEGWAWLKPRLVHRRRTEIA